MTSTIATQFWRTLGAALLFALPLLNASAQAPAASPPAAPAPAATAPVVAPLEAAKPAPELAPGSTAKPGWNVPPKWADVEQKAQYASVAGRETNVLIEDAGREWRVLRNGPLTFYGGIAILVVPTMLSSCRASPPDA